MMIMWPLLLLILINSLVIEAYPVLVFNNTQSLKEQDPSYAFLAKDVHLPEEFILCSSIRQARFFISWLSSMHFCSFGFIFVALENRSFACTDMHKYDYFQ